MYFMYSLIHLIEYSRKFSHSSEAFHQLMERLSEYIDYELLSSHIYHAFSVYNKDKHRALTAAVRMLA